ncbi:MAG: SDR family oxidoreductase [Rhodospirillales bacterium]|nr:SDR family oxidoreductase [Rhodospirillales bacterium]
MNSPSTIVITGASAGVGRATAVAFAKRGARVGLIARQADALVATVEDVTRAGGTGLALPLDLADADAVRAATERVEEELGPIDLWINAAMLTVFSPIRDLRAQEIRRVTDVTYLGSVNGILAALAHMRPRDRGTILQVGSALAYRGIPLQSAYCGAKFAIRGFLGSLHSELKSEGSAIRVCMVELPAVNTPQFEWARAHVPSEPRPVAPVFQPEAVADALVSAALDPRREYWLGWSSIKTIVGAQLMPEYLDAYLARHVISGQQSKRPILPGRIDNLEAPAPEEMHRARGRFDEEAGSSLVMVDPTNVRRAVIGASVALAAGIGAAIAVATRGRHGSGHPSRRRLERQNVV